MKCFQTNEPIERMTFNKIVGQAIKKLGTRVKNNARHDREIARQTEKKNEKNRQQCTPALGNEIKEENNTETKKNKR